VLLFFFGHLTKEILEKRMNGKFKTRKEERNEKKARNRDQKKDGRCARTMRE